MADRRQNDVELDPLMALIHELQGQVQAQGQQIEDMQDQVNELQGQVQENPVVQQVDSPPLSPNPHRYHQYEVNPEETQLRRPIEEVASAANAPPPNTPIDNAVSNQVFTFSEGDIQRLNREEMPLEPPALVSEGDIQRLNREEMPLEPPALVSEDDIWRENEEEMPLEPPALVRTHAYHEHYYPEPPLSPPVGYGGILRRFRAEVMSSIPTPERVNKGFAYNAHIYRQDTPEHGRGNDDPFFPQLKRQDAVSMDHVLSQRDQRDRRLKEQAQAIMRQQTQNYVPSPIKQQAKEYTNQLMQRVQKKRGMER